MYTKVSSEYLKEETNWKTEEDSSEANHKQLGQVDVEWINLAEERSSYRLL